RQRLRELREALPGIEIGPLPEDVELPPETGETFAENALAKARAAREATGRASIADDSGIEASGLGGRPGVRSARYAGADASDGENLAKLLDEVGQGGDRRGAGGCVGALAPPPGEGQLVSGPAEGGPAAPPAR